MTTITVYTFRIGTPLIDSTSIERSSSIGFWSICLAKLVEESKPEPVNALNNLPKEKNADGSKNT